jgi:hypothetical protein
LEDVAPEESRTSIVAKIAAVATARQPSVNDRPEQNE